MSYALDIFYISGNSMFSMVEMTGVEPVSYQVIIIPTSHKFIPFFFMDKI